MPRLSKPALAATVLLGLSAGAVQAQDAPASNPSDGWSFVVGAATDNRSKNASKSEGDPFAFAQATWESADGLFYAGPSAETIKSSTGSNLETDVSVGVRPQWFGFDWDLNVAYKYQIDADPGADNDAFEFTATVERSIGPAFAGVELQHSPDGTGGTEAWTWVALSGGWDFTDKLTASAEIGRREQDQSVDYTGWNAGFTYALTRDLEAEVRYHDTDAGEPGDQYAGALVAGISLAF